jgi:hypothetical protein
VLLRPVTLDESNLGQPLPWDLYTAAGALLVTSGTVVADPEQLRRLAGQPLYRKPDGAGAAGDPAQRLDALAQELSSLLLAPFTPLLETSLRSVVDDLRALHEQDPDACLGLVRLLPMGSPAVRHVLLAALVAQVIADALGLPDGQSASLAAAALTMNIADMPLHDALAGGPRGLSEAEQRAIAGHPERGVEILVDGGVTDRVWLAAVLAHHENMDGSGYPHRLDGARMPTAARILRVADYYCAKIGGRYYRPPRSPEHALRDIFGRERGRLDMTLAAQLLRRLGLYPPGTLVRLANRETAVVTRRAGPGKTVRHVMSILDWRGRPHETPRERDVTHATTAIQGLAETGADWPEVPWARCWGY